MNKILYYTLAFTLIWPAVRLLMGRDFSLWQVLAGAVAGLIFGYYQYRTDKNKTKQ